MPRNPVKSLMVQLLIPMLQGLMSEVSTDALTVNFDQADGLAQGLMKTIMRLARMITMKA